MCVYIPYIITLICALKCLAEPPLHMFIKEYRIIGFIGFIGFTRVCIGFIYIYIL